MAILFFFGLAFVCFYLPVVNLMQLSGKTCVCDNLSTLHWVYYINCHLGSTIRNVLLFFRGRDAKYCIEYVCMYLFLLTYLKTVQISLNFLCMLPVTLALSSCCDNAIPASSFLDDVMFAHNLTDKSMQIGHIGLTENADWKMEDQEQSKDGIFRFCVFQPWHWSFIFQSCMFQFCIFSTYGLTWGSVGLKWLGRNLIFTIVLLSSCHLLCTLMFSRNHGWLCMSGLNLT